MSKRRREKQGTCSSTSLSPDAHDNASSSEATRDASLGIEEAWIMQTSSGYDDDIAIENKTSTDNCNRVGKCGSNKQTDTEKKQHKMRKAVKFDYEEARESREARIKNLKALIRKQEKALDKLKPTMCKTKQIDEVKSARKKRCCNASRTHNPETEIGYNRGGLETRARSLRRRKVEYDNRVTRSRDVDIWMSRGELITKDEFLAVLSLKRVAKFHKNLP
ncbi:uncharacterized protein LOC114977688 [Acropora millepora]|uniref:uncharacterized protein LOC114977688 n=1 Tax=Acropora millepora TaxID=45264 RepID=UPI001CF46D9D|nr:uncharacterized protein LOC114977688 [Acropora millepora]